MTTQEQTDRLLAAITKHPPPIAMAVLFGQIALLRGEVHALHVMAKDVDDREIEAAAAASASIEDAIRDLERVSLWRKGQN